MTELSPAFLLSSPELVEPGAPWCVMLDNLDLGILVLTQPWLAIEGLRTAELERQLMALAVEQPLGPVYFQRVKRAVARLEAAGALCTIGAGRARRFRLTPEGMAALILNLQVLHRDPTLDGSELELKRALVVMWNLVLDRMAELPPEMLVSPETNRFFDELEQVCVLSERVITAPVVARALDVLGLLETQRGRVQRMMASAERRLELVERQAEALGEIDLGRLVKQGHGGAASMLASSPETMALVRSLATGVLPRLGLRATISRYRRYLGYLDDLTQMYAGQLRTVPIAGVRGILLRTGGR